MSDIIEELQAGAELEEAYDADGIIRTGYQRSLRWRAADEIERLRSHIAKLEAWQQEGEALLGENASLQLGAMFRFGKWWGERPWGKR